MYDSSSLDLWLENKFDTNMFYEDDEEYGDEDEYGKTVFDERDRMKFREEFVIGNKMYANEDEMFTFFEKLMRDKRPNFNFND